MRPIAIISAGILLACMGGIAPAASPAQEATLTNITLSTTATDLLLHMKLEGAFTEKVKRAVLSGIPTAITFTIILDEVRVLWLDEKVADVSVTHSVKYDNLKKEFTVRRSWKENLPEVTGSFEEAQALMSQIENLKVIALERMEKGTHYQLRTKAEVSKKTLPFNLHSILFFVSLWDVETDWTIIDFTY
jgi:hypothetical protein